MAIAVFSEYLDNAIVAMGPTSSSSSYNQDDNIAKVETTPPDMKPSVQDFFASFASLKRKGTTTVEEKFRKIVEDKDGKLKAIDKYERERALERRSVEAVRDKLRELEERSRRDPDYMVMKLEAIDRLERRRVESRLRGQQQIADGMRQMMEKVREGNLYSYCTCIGCQPSTPPTPAPQVDIEENAVQIFIKSNEESDKERNLEMVAEETEETEEVVEEVVEEVAEESEIKRSLVWTKFGPSKSWKIGRFRDKDSLYYCQPEEIWPQALKMKIRTMFNAIPREEAARAVKSMKESVDIEENAVQIFIESNEESEKERRVKMVAEKSEETEKVVEESEETEKVAEESEETEKVVEEVDEEFKMKMRLSAPDCNFNLTWSQVQTNFWLCLSLNLKRKLKALKLKRKPKTIQKQPKNSSKTSPRQPKKYSKRKSQMNNAGRNRVKRTLKER